MIFVGLMVPSDGEHGLFSLKSLSFLIANGALGSYIFLKQKINVAQLKMLLFVCGSISFLLIWLFVSLIHNETTGGAQFDQFKVFVKKKAKKPEVVGFEAMGDGVTFLTPPLARETEITGPSAVKLFVSSSTSDADIFVVLRVFSGDLKEVVFQGAIDPHTPIGQGWLRASHRQLDKKLSKPYRPYHTHTKIEPLKPGEVVALDVEIWPTSIVVPAGHRIALTIRGKDYVYPGPSGGRLSNFKNELTGCGPFLHDDARDRPPQIFGGVTGLHFGGAARPYLLLPVIPSKRK